MSGFIIVVDDREKKPYEFPSPYVYGRLPSGDYSIKGYETRIAVERKRPCELFANFTTHRDRFRREWERLSTYEEAHLVIEGDIYACATQYDRHSSVSPHVVISSLMKWSRRYRVEYHFLSDRLMAQTWTYRTLQNFFVSLVEVPSVSTTQAP